MEKLFSCIMLLAVVALCVPGCIAEENKTAEGISITVAGEENGDLMPNETGSALAADLNGTEMNETPLSVTYTADLNLTELEMMISETVLISLRENPTTGYSWNVTNSSGLAIINDTYVTDDTEELMAGVGGFHSWTAKAVEAGNQTFTAVMMHVADKPAGNEETYTLHVIVGENSAEEKPVAEV